MVRYKASGAPAMSLWSMPLAALLAAQFLSAMADNMLFVGALALLKRQAAATLQQPLLAGGFFIAYVLLAPFVGHLADRYPKSRVMWFSNSIKLMAAIALSLGCNPVVAYLIAGIGAACYGPAKYGLLIELLPLPQLIKGNGLLEGSTLVAIILGVVLGGVLADHSISGLLWATIGVYGLALIGNAGIPALKPQVIAQSGSLLALVRAFGRQLAALWGDADARFSLCGTSLFWSIGALLRLALFVWVPLALNNHDNALPATLMGLVSIGIVGGALLAGGWIKLTEEINRVLLPGFLLGPSVGLLLLIHHASLAFIHMVIIGIIGGLFVVPLNALLQQRGQQLTGVGKALAIQNFWENGAMLAMMAVYAGALAIPIGLDAILLAVAALVTLIVAVLARYRWSG